MLQVIRLPVQLCVPLLAGIAAGQPSPMLEASTAAVKFCSHNGVRSVRVHIVFTATNVSSVTAVIPQIVDISSAWITDLANGKRREYNAGYRPQLSRESLNKLQSEGGGVVALAKDERARILGMYLVLMMTQREAERVGGKPRVLLHLGRSYEIRAAVRFWTEEQFQRWRRLGYVTQRNATVVARFEVPPNPEWRPCPDEPPFARERPSK